MWYVPSMIRLTLVILLGLPALAQAPYDTIVSGGRIVDGTGNAWFYGDLAVRNGRIARITPAGILRNAAARERIDATGLIVSPGFIDIQSQSRAAFLTQDGRVISKVTQVSRPRSWGKARPTRHRTKKRRVRSETRDVRQTTRSRAPTVSTRGCGRCSNMVGPRTSDLSWERLPSGCM